MTKSWTLTITLTFTGNGSGLTNLNASNLATGTLPAGQFPALTGPVTTTAGSLGTSYETTAVSTSIAATGDAPITYALYSGSLPTGVTLASNGTLSGTSPVEASSTTYSFVVQATDAQLQDTTRSFSLTISSDIVTWSSPAADYANVLVGNAVMSNVTLAATSAAGYGITYAANTLPTGVSLSDNTIFGTPTVEETVYTAITATATELNHVDGVTGNIQTQIDANTTLANTKASKAFAIAQAVALG